MKTEKEIWKDVDGYEGLYKVSNLGRVKNISYSGRFGTYTRDRIMKPSTNKEGYKYVCLHKGGKHYTTMVHRLVAGAFCEKPEGKNTMYNRPLKSMPYAQAHEEYHEPTLVGATRSLSSLAKGLQFIDDGSP